MVLLNKDCGLSHGKIARVFRDLFGIALARATSVRAVLRTAQRLAPAHAEVRQAIRAARTLTPDETGWRVGGQTAWLHVAATAEATAYVIDPTRSAEPLADLIGGDWAGTLIHDGWAAYDRFRQADHQQCLRHLQNRARELLETATRGAVRFPRAVQDLLARGLDVRDRWQAGTLSDHGRLVLGGRLREELRRLVGPLKTHPGHERLAAFLERHLDEVFLFLRRPELEATNWRAEQAIRPAVVNRKVWGGNRTWPGAQAQAILMSVLRTCQQQSRNALEFLSHTLRSPLPIPLFATGR
jgi:transposase